MSLGLVGTGSAYKIYTATQGNTNLISRPGRVAQVIVWNVGTTATIDIYDDSGTGTTNHIWSWASADGKGVFALQIPVQSGIAVTVAGTAPSFTLVYA